MGTRRPQSDILLMGAGAPLGSFEAAGPQVPRSRPVPPGMRRAQ